MSGMPINVSATYDSVNRVVIIDWDNGTSGTEVLLLTRIWRSTQADLSDEIFVTSAGPSTTALQDFSADVAGQTYYYRLDAYYRDDPDGPIILSEKTAAVSVVAIDPVGPPEMYPLTDLSASFNTTTSTIDLTWSANGNDISNSSYWVIYRNTTGIFDTSNPFNDDYYDDVSAGTTSYSDDWWEYAATYYYQLRPINQYNQPGPVSSILSFTVPDLPAPPTPPNFTLSQYDSFGFKGIRIDFDLVENGDYSPWTEYYIFFSVDGGSTFVELDRAQTGAITTSPFFFMTYNGSYLPIHTPLYLYLKSGNRYESWNIRYSEPTPTLSITLEGPRDGHPIKNAVDTFSRSIPEDWFTDWGVSDSGDTWTNDYSSTWNGAKYGVDGRGIFLPSDGSGDGGSFPFADLDCDIFDGELTVDIMIGEQLYDGSFIAPTMGTNWNMGLRGGGAHLSLNTESGPNADKSGGAMTMYVAMGDLGWQRSELVTLPFSAERFQWYTVKLRVTSPDCSSALLQGKVWVKGTSEPDWQAEYLHPSMGADFTVRQTAHLAFGYSQSIGPTYGYYDNLFIEDLGMVSGCPLVIPGTPPAVPPSMPYLLTLF